jgi:hypothetical protein
MTSLHDLTGQYLELASNEDLPADAVIDTLQSIVGTIEDKANALVKWSLDIQGDIDKIDAEIDRLSAKKKAVQNRKDSLIEYIKNNMEACEIKKISCPLFTITLVAGQDVVDVFDADAIPDDYVNVKTTVTPDKNAIKKALQNGAEVAGCKLSTGKSSIRIK